TALHKSVRVLLGGNHFPIYQITYALAAQTGDYFAILQEGITLSRAETGYQIVELLRQTENAPTTTLISDMLTPLMDDSLKEKEAGELLFESILELRRLAKFGQVYISAHTPQPRPHLLLALTRAAGAVWQTQPTPAALSRPRQGRLA
ncbi:MAG: hypothetical protein KQI62_21605, partial [Deltaproteobacteria bacterium]|nr:hypothetical protein [Deltaproteobacteria bacterium]